MKLCTRCKKEPRVTNRLGLCRLCHNLTKKEHSDKMRMAIAGYKLEKGCADCSYNENHAALEFDHIKGVKKYNIANMTRWSWKNILREIAKCDVVCANCHRIREWNKKQKRKDK